MRRRKRRILEAATKLITEGGMEACTMRALARKARLDVTTLYNYYGSKEEILEALRRSGARKLRRRIEELPKTDPIERIRSVVDLMLGVRESPAALARPINLPVPRHRPGAGPIERVAMEQLELEFQRAVEEGQLLPAIDPELVIVSILGHSIAWLSLWAKRVSDAEETAARVGYALSLSLLAVATDGSRSRLRQEMLQSQQHLLTVAARASAVAAV